MKKVLIGLALSFGLSGFALAPAGMAESKELGFHLLVAYHQPLSTHRGKTLDYPWARLSALRLVTLIDALERYPEAKVSLSISPTLLKQLSLLSGGAEDPLYLAARTPLKDANPQQREILEQAWGSQASRALKAWRQNPALLLARDFAQKQDPATLLRIHDQEIKGLLPRISKLVSQGRVELVAMPYSHPSMQALPESEAKSQFSKGIRAIYSTYHSGPKGLWPTEGVLESKHLPILRGYGFRWFAAFEPGTEDPLVPYQTPSGPAVFWGHPALSQLTNASTVLARLGAMAKKTQLDHPIATLVLEETDLANQADHGKRYFEVLFRGLSRSQEIEAELPSEYLSHYPIPILERWISPVKKASSGLYEQTANQFLDDVRKRLALSKHARISEAREMLELAESTDWLDWYRQEPGARPQSDELFRGYLRSALVTAGEKIPQGLMNPILPPDVVPAWTPKAPFSPRLDGDLREWGAAGRVKETSLQMDYGWDSRNLHLGFTFPGRVIPFLRLSIGVLGRPGGREVKNIPFYCHYQTELSLGGGDLISLAQHTALPLKAASKKRTMEVAIPWNQLGLKSGEACFVMATLPGGKTFPCRPLKLRMP